MEPARQPLQQSTLPLYLTTFVGRVQEQATLNSLLLERSLLTLVGAGGIGKTRLALHSATELAASFPDGIFLIELASLSEPAMLLQTVTSTLVASSSTADSATSAAQIEHENTPLQQLITALQQQRCLLVFDNCEHMLSACASLIEALLSGCPELHILATSREPLQLAEEYVWRVAALAFPQPEPLPALEELVHYEAIQLFCQRATEIDSYFELSAENAPTILRICQQLDGIPLALELAAARLSVFSVEQLAARLNERFALLTDGARIAPSHQQTLQATFDWSYALLIPEEQALFERVAVFAGSWNREAAEQILGPNITAPYATRDVLTNLVNKSLIIAEAQEGEQEDEVEEIRYRLLKTVQLYAQEKGEQAQDWQTLCAQHDAWYLQLAEEAGTHLHDAEQLLWLRALETDMPDIRATLARFLATAQYATAVRLAEALSRFWVIRNHFSEGRYWFDTLLIASQHNTELSPLLRAQILTGAARFARYQGQQERASMLLEEQIALLQTLDEPERLAEAQVDLGTVLAFRGLYERAYQLCEASLNFYRTQRQIKGVIRTLLALAFIALGQGKYARVITLSEELCALLRKAGDYSYLLYALFPLAQATILQGKLEQARSICQEALQLSQQLKQPFGLAASIGLIAGIARLQGELPRAAWLFGAAHALQERARAPLPPAGQAVQERMLFLVRDAMSKEAFLQHYSAGQGASLEQILAEAEAVLQAAPPQSAPAETPPVSSTPSPLAQLSQREREILRLVAAGLSDAQVATRLLISRYTVSSHLQSIYSKLQINSRGAATRLALEHGLD